MRRYLQILARPGALTPFLASFAARMSISMIPLGIVLLVQAVRGSYGIAGVVTGAYTVGAALGAPLWGRSLDRVGIPRVIAPLALVSGALLAVLALACVNGAPDGALVALAVAVGLSYPTIGAAMRATWRVVLPDADRDAAHRHAAYALEGVAIELIYVLGPLLLSGLIAVAAPVVPLLVTSLLLAGGGVVYALSGVARAWRAEPHQHGEHVQGASPLRAPGVTSALAVAVLIAIAFGLLDVSLAATANLLLHDTTRVGLLFLAVAGGSAVGGTWYGARQWRVPERIMVPFPVAGFSLGCLTVTLLLAAGARSLLVLMPVLFLIGLSIAPGLIMLTNLVDAYAPRDRLGEAQSWLTTAFTAGAAGGTALAGGLVDSGGPIRSFAVGAAAIGVAATIAVAAQRVWRGEVAGVARG